MPKTSRPTKAKTSNPAKAKASRKSERNYRLSEEALGLVEKVKERRGNLSDFVSRCIAEYGPLILEGAEDSSGEKAPLPVRLDYLERNVVAWAYDELIGEDSEWDAATIKAHQEILKATNKKQWHNAKSIKEILAAAENDPKTEETEPYVWQTLLRCRKDFLAIK